MKPEDITDLVTLRKERQEAARREDIAKLAAKAVFWRDKATAEKQEMGTPGERFDAVWCAVIAQINEPLIKNHMNQTIAVTPAKKVQVMVNEKQVDYSLSLSIFAVDNKPLYIASLWSTCDSEHYYRDFIHDVEERVFSSVRFPERYDPAEHDRSLRNLANVETTLAAYLNPNVFADAATLSI